jgi:predicted MFS family arabinose efflux permease
LKRILGLYKESFTGLHRNIWVLSISMFINRSGSMVLLFTSLYLTNDLGFTLSQAGWALSMYGIGSVLGSYIGGWLTDRYHFYNIMLWSLIISGLILLLMLVVHSLYGIAAILFLYALLADVFRPANSSAIAVYSSAADRTRSVSLVRLAVNLGFSVGPAVGGIVALHLGYKWLFVIDSFTGFGAAFMLYKFLPKQIKTTTDFQQLPKSANSSAYRDGYYLLFVFFVALYAISFFQIFASVPQYFSKVCNYPEDLIGMLLALNGCLVVLLEMPFVTATQGKSSVFKYILIGALCVPASFLILQFHTSIFISILFIVVITFSEIFAMPFMMNYALSRPTKERQGQYSALYSMAYGIAIIFAPSVGLGLASIFGFNNAFYFFVLIGFISALGFWYLKNNPNKTVN